MLRVWATIKTYGLLILSGLVAVLAFLLKISGSRTKRYKEQSETFKAKAHHAKTVMKKDVEADREYDERTQELAKEIEDKKTSKELSDPNSDW